MWGNVQLSEGLRSLWAFPVAKFPKFLLFFCLHSIIVKLKQYEEFFPAFHALTVDILQTLGKLLEHSDSLIHLNALDILILLQ